MQKGRDGGRGACWVQLGQSDGDGVGPARRAAESCVGKLLVAGWDTQSRKTDKTDAGRGVGFSGCRGRVGTSSAAARQGQRSTAWGWFSPSTLLCSSFRSDPQLTI
eukprot:SAG22_NODE_10990_length_506_cov_0.889435_1_plen_105_part_01